jgi:hypothetical protein
MNDNSLDSFVTTDKVLRLLKQAGNKVTGTNCYSDNRCSANYKEEYKWKSQKEATYGQP